MLGYTFNMVKSSLLLITIALIDFSPDMEENISKIISHGSWRQITHMQKQDDPLNFGRRLIGSVLKKIRKQAGLKTDFGRGEVGIRASMVRMIEAGHAGVPVARIPAYAAALSVRAALGGPLVDPETLALAYASLRSLSERDTKKDRFDWRSLGQTHEEEAKKYIYEQLTHQDLYSRRGQSELAREFGVLNPIQLQLVREIAKRVQVFGSDIVSDGAIAEWEKANAKQIIGIRAAVTSLASELSDKYKYIESLAAMVKENHFLRCHYLIVSDSGSEVDATWKELKGSILAKMLNGKISDEEKSKAEAKLQCTRINLRQYKEIEHAIASTSTANWDAIYAYEFDSGPMLMIGAFRRLPALTNKVSSVSLKDWGAAAMGEALPTFSAHEFITKHDTLWNRLHTHE